MPNSLARKCMVDVLDADYQPRTLEKRGPQLVTSPGIEMKFNVTIHIYGNKFQAEEKHNFTETELDAYVDDLLREGYTSQTGPKSRVIYPAHTIQKIGVAKD